MKIKKKRKAGAQRPSKQPEAKMAWAKSGCVGANSKSLRESGNLHPRDAELRMGGGRSEGAKSGKSWLTNQTKRS